LYTLTTASIFKIEPVIFLHREGYLSPHSTLKCNKDRRWGQAEKGRKGDRTIDGKFGFYGRRKDMKRCFVLFRLVAGLVVSIMVLVSNISIAMAYEKEIKTISSSIAESVTTAGKKTVAVVDFTDLQGNVTELGRFLAEEISVDMTIAAKGFEVIDRTHLNSVMKEHELSMLGITDPKKIKKLGEVAGVDAIVTGSVTPFGDSIRITCKVIATDTARTIGASKGDIAKTKAIEELLARGIENTATTKGPASTPSVKKETKAGQKAEAQNFTFELKGCKMSGSITCDFMITNNGQDRKLEWGHPNSRIFDDSGNEYRQSDAQLGNKRGRGTGFFDMGTMGVQNLLVSGIYVKASVTFEKVSSQANMIALLEINNATDGNDFKVQFRNIPLTK